MDIIGIGLANIDLVAHIKDDFLARHKIQKGLAKKVDELSFARLRGDLAHFDAIPGGCAANTLCGMAAMGVSTQFLGKIGNDSFESLYRASFADYGVAYDTAAAMRESSQCAVLVTPEGERSFAYMDGASWDLSPVDLQKAGLPGARMICAEIYSFEFDENSGTARHVIECARDNAVPLIIKVMDRDFGHRYAQKLRALAEAGILTLIVGNHDNLPSVTEAHSLEECITAFKDWPCDVLLTANRDGAWFVSGGRATHFPVTPIEKPRNTTGAGDQFLAGFLTAQLDKRSVTECMNHGAYCARQMLMHDTARPPLVNRHSIRF